MMFCSAALFRTTNYILSVSAPLNFFLRVCSNFYSNSSFRLCDAANHRSDFLSSSFDSGSLDFQSIETKQKSLISKFIALHNGAEHENWCELLQNVFSLSTDTFSHENVDHKIISYCGKLMKLNLARSYLEYMKKLERKFDGAVCCEFLNLCYNCRQSLSEQDKKRVSIFTEFLRKKYVSPDRYICEGIIKGLLLQKKTDVCLKMLAQAKHWDQVNEDTYTALIISAVENEDFLSASAFIEEMTKTYYLNSRISVSWLKASFGNRNHLDELLRIYRNIDYKPTKNICNQLIENYAAVNSKQRLKGQYMTLSKGISMCSICSSQLNPIEISDAEYKLLRETITNKLLVGDEVYKNTMPYELEKFHALMNQYGPFDVIIDGLNIAYSINQTGYSEKYVLRVEQLLWKLHEKNFKIMFVGKWHMRKWPGLLDILRKYDSRYFFVEDISSDDAYILCATLFGESRTFLISRDNMSHEKLKLSFAESKLFERWYLRHRILLNFNRGGIEVLPPVNYEMMVQQTSQGGWHIPYKISSDKICVALVYDHWLCLKPELNISTNIG